MRPWGAAATGGLPGRGWVVFFGSLDVVAGIVLIAAPVTSTKVLAVLAGIVLIVLGLIGAVAALGVGRGATRTDATWQAGSASR
ncbi:DUF308 domain-containing protein, partial [Embleya sp. NPDC005575]|uniref:DUF308 domain-containing protein n=1 Tax=Embleya sp. NPDC005575 TaxID=3156892 RepID=UPI0033A4A1F0